MNELMNFVPNANSEATMSSREIATLTGKNHQHVLRDCDILNESYEKMALSKIGQSQYKADNGQTYREYRLTKLQTFDLMTGYNTELRIKVNRRWAELEAQTLTKADVPALPKTYKEALQSLLTEVENNERLQAQNDLQRIELQKQAPKVAYYNEVLTSQSTYNANQIAKELGMSAESMNKLLHKLEVQYKQGGQWLLYRPHQNKGYTKTITHTYTNSQGQTCSRMSTVWTEKGREFIHSIIK